MKIVGALLLAGLLVVAGGYFVMVKPQLDALSAPGARAGEVSFEVPAGSTQKNVIQRLEQAGIIEDWRVLYYYARFSKLGAPRAGEYTFAPTASVLELMEKMRRGEVTMYTIGFPEGLSYREIAPRLEATGFVKAAELLKACEDAAFLKENKVPGTTCEGYLFPDTYKIPKGKTTRELVSMFIAHHHEMFAKATSGKTSSLSAAQIVTLASIVEKETGAVEERPHIAGLFLNRLEKGMRLETDPTVIYAAILAGTYDGNIHKSDLLFDHPYNTYKRAGLPPGPICNPGFAALQAVMSPMASEDLFFVSKNDGTHVFSATLEAHEKAVDVWQRQFFRKKRAKK